jgi:CHAD domain-containing protein
VARRASAPSGTPSLAALRRGLRTLRLEVEREVDEATGDRPASPETLHDLHRDLRRLASGLVLWGDLLNPPDAAEVRPVVRRIRRFARLVGRIRDRDVTLALLDPLARRRAPAREARAFHAFLGRIREDTRTGRELLRAFLTSERRGGLFEQVRRIFERTPRLGASRLLVGIVHDAWRDHHRRVRKAHRKARRHPDVDRLHRLRIHIRRWRHLAALADLAAVPPPESIEAGLRTLQERLGELHDLDLARASIPDELKGSAPARAIARALEVEHRAIERQLAKGPRSPRRARRPVSQRGG